MNLVYIISPSFSGSTLLTFLLAAHPDVATVGELKATAMGDINLYSCSCGKLLRECQFWRRVGNELRRCGGNFDLADFGTHFRLVNRPLVDRLLRARVRGPVLEAARAFGLWAIPGARRTFQQILERNRLLIDVVTRLKSARLFLDSSKDPVRLKYLAASGYWAIKVIYLIRDGRGTAASYMKHAGMSMEGAALEWRRRHEECERLVSSLPNGSWIRIRYEDLCRNPEEAVDLLFRFIGLRPIQNGRDIRTIEQHILGNSMRLKSTSEIVADETWRAQLRPQEGAIFERLAGAVNRRYGYNP